MYQGLLMGGHFASACQRGACGQVHSVFDRAVNIETRRPDGEGSLLTLLCADSDVMPAALVTSLRGESWRDCVKVGNTVLFTKDAIFLGSAPFLGGISSATVWEPVDPARATGLRRLSHEEITARCGQVHAYIKHSGIRLNESPVMGLSDLDVTRLLGLGDGLTPSGDDFLAGLLLAIHFAKRLYGRECAYLPAIIHSTLHHMPMKTNEISRHFLRYACEGLWGGATQRFLLALFGNDDDRLRMAVAEKLSYGATSGLDEMCGILFGLREAIPLFGEG